MKAQSRTESWKLRLARLRRQRRFQNALTFGLVALGPVLAVATYLALGPFNLRADSSNLRLVLLADLVYVLLVATLVLARVARMVADRRSQSAGSRLHMRLSGVFAVVALVPTVLVAVFAVLTVNIGLEGWFSERVSNVVGSSLAAAQAYEQEHRDTLMEDASSLAGYLEIAKQSQFFLEDRDIRPLLTQGQAAVQRGLKEVFLIDGAGTLHTRGERSYLFDFENPSAAELARAMAGEVVLIEDWPNNEFRALVYLESYPDRYLYVARKVDGAILGLLDETQQNVALYQQLELARGQLLFNFGLLYLGFAVIVILAAVWGGLWFAERLSRPVGRLALAAQRVGAGDLDIQVIEEAGDDEISMLGRLFNQMTRQLKGQREALLDSNQQSETRRRLFDSVLSSVTAGVIGLDGQGRIDFANPAAARLLDFLAEDIEGQQILIVVPEFSPLLARLQADDLVTAQEELRLIRRGRQESLLVRLSERRGAGGLEGFVIAFDDVTDLVSAQRMAAWGDVARRIAHEIKNPLTPIQLSAERIKRKYTAQVRDPQELEQYTDVIIRQTNDLRRIVDEFSKFARMPVPVRKEEDLVALIKGAVLLQENGQPEVDFVKYLPAGPALIDLDATMIGQALINLIKNAGESIDTMREKLIPGYRGQIRVSLHLDEADARVTIADNGTGLPPDRARLFEPYVTTRDKGTGLGLPIVKKIIEEHGGTLDLTDAEVFDGNSHLGAMAVIHLPRAPRRKGARKATGE